MFEREFFVLEVVKCPAIDALIDIFLSLSFHLVLISQVASSAGTANVWSRRHFVGDVVYSIIEKQQYFQLTGIQDLLNSCTDFTMTFTPIDNLFVQVIETAYKTACFFVLTRVKHSKVLVLYTYVITSWFTSKRCRSIECFSRICAFLASWSLELSFVNCFDWHAHVKRHHRHSQFRHPRPLRRWQWLQGQRISFATDELLVLASSLLFCSPYHISHERNIVWAQRKQY